MYIFHFERALHSFYNILGGKLSDHAESLMNTHIVIFREKRLELPGILAGI